VRFFWIASLMAAQSSVAFFAYLGIFDKAVLMPCPVSAITSSVRFFSLYAWALTIASVGDSAW
jgi:hypothetical protein